MAAAVHLFEHHDEAYHVWVERGVRARPLVHVDAHHDLAWLDAGADLTISNYVCQALKDGCAADVIWVPPDALLETAAGRRQLAGQLNALLRGYGAPRRARRATPDRLRIELLGRRVEILPLDHLPRDLGPVLLDIDTDFLIVPDAALPWVWPSALAARLHTRRIEPEVCTIAYSVDGGYTPLAWKYLGFELACAMRGDASDAPTRTAFALLRAAAESAAQGDVRAAERALRQAAGAPPELAAARWYRLARLLVTTGRTAEARAAYRSARASDPSYGTAYESGGFWHLDDDHVDRAERAFRLALELDPPDGWALLGLARVAQKRRDWASVESWATKALDKDPTLVDAHRLLGRVRERQRRWRDASVAYRRSLALALRGCSPLRQPIASRRGDQRVADVEHGRTYLRVALTEARDGQLDAAAAAFRVGLAVDPRRPIGHARFAALSVRRGQWSDAARHLAAACAAMPAAIRSWNAKTAKAAKENFLCALSVLRVPSGVRKPR